MPIRNMVLTVACVVVCLVVAGCVTRYIPVLVESEPSGLEVRLNGEPAGATPVVVELGTRLPEHRVALRTHQREAVRAVVELREEGLAVVEWTVLEGEWTLSHGPGTGGYSFVLRFVRAAP